MILLVDWLFFKLRVKDVVLVLCFDDLRFYKAEYLFLKCLSMIDNYYSERYNRFLKETIVKCPSMYLAKSRNKSWWLFE